MPNNLGWICPKCDTAISPSEKSCPVCASKVEADKNQQSDLEKQKADIKKAMEELARGSIGKSPAWPMHPNTIPMPKYNNPYDHWNPSKFPSYLVG